MNEAFDYVERNFDKIYNRIAQLERAVVALQISVEQLQAAVYISNWGDSKLIGNASDKQKV